MKVYKFGGASVKDAGGITNLARIVSSEKDGLIVVISAFGKTTNNLEGLLKNWLADDPSYLNCLEDIFSFHRSIIAELFPNDTYVTSIITTWFNRLREYMLNDKSDNYDYEYDQIVSYGELWSTLIVSEYLKTQFESVKWIDIREFLLTDDRYRDANVLWKESTHRVKRVFDVSKYKLYVTQGFIGGTARGLTSTLGREGSDYTAAILANMVDAICVVVWKDVPGILNADPKWMPDAEKLDEISYKEAVEMTFSGAKIIHPKTIKPLHNKNIPLYIRSFIDPSSEGTVIKYNAELKKVMPVFVKKDDQILISILPKDFSFVMGDNLGIVFHSFNTCGIKVNLVEASAVSIDVCVDDERPKVEKLLKELESRYTTIYNDNVEMLSIRHYNPEAVKKITYERDILIEQRTRTTIRLVVRKLMEHKS
jgi:aspartate kinase